MISLPQIGVYVVKIQVQLMSSIASSRQQRPKNAINETGYVFFVTSFSRSVSFNRHKYPAIPETIIHLANLDLYASFCYIIKSTK